MQSVRFLEAFDAQMSGHAEQTRVEKAQEWTQQRGSKRRGIWKLV